MCGICGLLDLSGGLGPAADVALDRMSRSLRRRGPDDAGRWGDTEGRVRLAFRRLAILDLSPAGAQPMLSPSGRTAMVFNGEIYNFRQLRRELGEDAASLGSTGDSAVLLAAFERWGLDALPRLDGMFAAAFWETDQRRLTLVRDRFGIKPLSLFEPGNGRLAFASRYDTLLRSPWSGGLGDRVRRDALRLFLRLGHLPAPWAVLDTTRQLEAGAWLQVEANGTRRDGRFWRPPTATADLERDPRRALERIEDAIESSVERQLAADVPLGVFLSGGVDSPLVAAAARAAHNRPIDAFTLGVPGWAQDESADARRLAGPLDLRHHLLKIEDAALVDAVDAVRQAQHEPFADYSMVPTLLISRFARERVKVALSGDGGDELFFGYERPRSLLRDGELFRWPRRLRHLLYLLGRLGLGPRRSDVIVHPTAGDYYFSVNCRFPVNELEALAPDIGPLPAGFDLYRGPTASDARSLAEFSRRVEIGGQLQRGLKKVDMASMHHGLEVRVPLLGNAVVEASFAIDPLLHLGDGGRKVLLRRALTRRVPAETLQQRKLGFGIPLGTMLRGPLRPLVEGTLFDRPLWPAGLFDRAAVERFWRRHQREEVDRKWALWALLSLQWWSERALDGATT